MIVRRDLSRLQRRAALWRCGALSMALASTAACTTLGPMPATTAVSAVPAARPDAEVQLGTMPGYFLSSAVTESPKGASISQLAALLEPDRIVGVPGLVVGARLFGPEGDTSLEPMLGYRRALGTHRRLALSGVAYGTHAAAAKNGASYQATRVGAELGLDLRLLDENRWAEPHLLAGGSLTALSAEGEYCVDDNGRYGVDCPKPPTEPNRATTSTSGLYPTATGGLALDLIRHRESPFHGGRLLFVVATGAMPRVIASDQRSPHAYAALGLAFSLAFGAPR